MPGFSHPRRGGCCSGPVDFLLEVVVPDLEQYEQLLLGRLLKLPGVADVRSSFAIRTVKSNGALPLGRLGGRGVA